MRIDIHTHTLKVKSGDAPTREITAEKFIETIKNTDVKILAITNHNHFDSEQYVDFRDGVAGICQVWPGIELDILENGKRAHMIVICNPKNYVQFEKVVKSILVGTTADKFSIGIRDTVKKFDDLDCIYIAHYFVKRPDLGDEELNLLANEVKNPKRILKEATNAISVGIYISHGHNSIYGSDVHDWSDYALHSQDLPELRLPVESFEQFCLLLEKDAATINTILDKRIKENIEINMFSMAEKLKLDIYSDINILFGSKGTGKTKILENLSKYFNGKGHRTSVYMSNDKHIDDVFDIKGNNYSASAATFGIDDCHSEIQFLKTVTEKDVTSLRKYYLHFAGQVANKNAQKIKIKDILVADETEPERVLDEVSSILEEFKGFQNYIEENDDIDNYVDSALLSELVDVLQRITDQLKGKTESRFFELKSIELLNGLVTLFTKELAKKTGQPQKPTKTGFADYARNRISIERASRKIAECSSKKIEPLIEYVGSLGLKGQLSCQTKVAFQNGTLTDASYTPVNNVKKQPQKNFSIAIQSIMNHVYSTELFSKIADLNAVDGIETIKSISDLLLKHRHFILDGNDYRPSNGESSMILLHRELSEEKDIYLIDEPEKSLGNDYISEVIVPLLKEKALLGKKVIIATHDANIAVRTLPYNSIYRLHDQGRYFTMAGNPFSNSLKCINQSRPDLNWKEISMKTLEGGAAAFGERGKIYGN
ncbi:MAG: hypothetical protein JSS76_17815 [Bacteroidetes bacterium]|nr:hypothetical protein [Bacteroidota bacterium]